MLLDIKTAYFLLGLFYIVMPASAYLYLQEHRTIPVKLWCLGGLLNGLGFLIISFRPVLQGHVPEFFTFTFVNVLVMTGYSIRIQSLRLEMKRALPAHLIFAGLLVFGICYQLIVLMSDKFEYRVLFGLAGVAIMAFTLSTLIKVYLRYFSINRMSYIGLIYFLLGLTVSAKFVLLLLGYDDANILKSSLINAVMTLTGLFAVIYSNIGYVGVVLAKIQNEYKISLSKNIEMADILEKRNLVIKDLMRAQAFSTVGTYGSTVIHEVLQPLTALRFGLANLETFILKTNDSLDVKERLSAVKTPAERAIGVIENLRNFMVERNIDVKPVPLHAALENAVNLAQGRISGLGVNVSIDSTISNSYVLADPHQLERVFFNLINNALDAIERKSGVDVIRSIVVKLQYIQQKQFVLIKIIDSGEGIPAGMESTIFEWLETHSGGMGLGLPLTRMLVESWQGTINAYRASAEVDGLSGAVFELKLRSAQQ